MIRSAIWDVIPLLLLRDGLTNRAGWLGCIATAYLEDIEPTADTGAMIFVHTKGNNLCLDSQQECIPGARRVQC